jgi:hypothetical protein
MEALKVRLAHCGIGVPSGSKPPGVIARNNMLLREAAAAFSFMEDCGVPYFQRLSSVQVSERHELPQSCWCWFHPSLVSSLWFVISIPSPCVILNLQASFPTSIPGQNVRKVSQPLGPDGPCIECINWRHCKSKVSLLQTHRGSKKLFCQRYYRCL